MTNQYDHYYQTENLFGEPSNELIDYFQSKDTKAKVLDIGCGQGRNALALGRIGFNVTGVDHSKTGIDQLNSAALQEGLTVTGVIGDMFQLDGLNNFDYFILDSMFHFTKKDREAEINFLKSLLTKAKPGAEIVICNQDTGDKCTTIIETLCSKENAIVKLQGPFNYIFKDSTTGHKSTTPYKFMVFEKIRNYLKN